MYLKTANKGIFAAIIPTDYEKPRKFCVSVWVYPSPNTLQGGVGCLSKKFFYFLFFGDFQDCICLLEKFFFKFFLGNYKVRQIAFSLKFFQNFF